LDALFLVLWLWPLKSSTQIRVGHKKAVLRQGKMFQGGKTLVE